MDAIERCWQSGYGQLFDQQMRPTTVSPIRPLLFSGRGTEIGIYGNDQLDDFLGKDDGRFVDGCGGESSHQQRLEAKLEREERHEEDGLGRQTGSSGCI